MTREEEMLLDKLNHKKEYEARCSNYIFDLSSYFRSMLGNVELFEDTINGEETSLDYCPAHLTVISIKARFDIDKEEFNDYIYCCLFENDGYYRIYRTESIYFEYDDKCYNIDVEWGNYELSSGNYNIACDVYEYDKSMFDLSSSNIIAYQNKYHKNQESLTAIYSKSLKLSLDYKTNVIAEVISRIRKEDKSRTHKS